MGLELDSLEKRLQDASKARENKLRKAGLPGRVQVRQVTGEAGEMWFFDTQVGDGHVQV